MTFLKILVFFLINFAIFSRFDWEITFSQIFPKFGCDLKNKLIHDQNEVMVNFKPGD